MLCDTCKYGHIIIFPEDDEGEIPKYVHCGFSDTQVAGEFDKCNRYQFENKMFEGVLKY